MTERLTREPQLACAYFEHAWMKEHLDEMQGHGFDTALFCLTEPDVLEPRPELAPVMQYAAHIGLERWVDLWSFGKVFGGEGPSPFQEHHDQPCLNNPRFRRLLTDGIDLAQTLGASTLFWDEPNFTNVQNANPCSCCAGREYELIEQVCRYAKGHALQNAVCFTTQDKHFEIMEALADAGLVDIIATDPYYYPNFPGHGRLDNGLPDTYDNYVGRAAKALLAITNKYPNTEAMIAVQTFHLPVPQEDGEAWKALADSHPWENVAVESAAAAARAGVSKILVWGFGACRNYPELAPYYPDRIWEATRHIRETVRRDLASSSATDVA